MSTTHESTYLIYIKSSYLLHGNLWLGGHVLLGVAHTGSIFVLGHGAHWGGSG